MTQNISNAHRFLIIFTIVFAGEIIFSLPFHVARFFRPTLLEVFQLSNTQLGDIFGLYGVMAMLAYFPGGAIADKFSAKHLMAFSLFTTALGGIVFIQIPSVFGLTLLFGYWGLTTILLFWAAMIKVTRLWGGEQTQGLAFGILDGGRGFVAAGLASISVLILSYMLPENAATQSDKTMALQYVIGFYAALTLVAGLLILAVIPSGKRTNDIAENSDKYSLKDSLVVLRQPTVILQALIVLSAYSAYKSLDYFGIYAANVLQLDDIASAQLVSNASFMRPLVAICAGLLADKLQPSRLISSGIGGLMAAYLLFIPLNDHYSWLIQANIFITFILVFTVRAIYFALLAQSNIDRKVTGTAVGIISVVGFTPDIFFAPIAGRIIDSTPGVEGFNLLFTSLILLSTIGLVSAILLTKRSAHAIQSTRK